MVLDEISLEFEKECFMRMLDGLSQEELKELLVMAYMNNINNLYELNQIKQNILRVFQLINENC